MRKVLGKISSVKFGHCGYQDACLGISFSFSMDGSGVGADKSAWDANMVACNDHSKWTEQDRSKQYDEIMRFVSDLLHQAKVHNVNDLKDVPVELEFEGMCLKDWRILTEVI